MSRIQIWILASRPKTLPAASVPVIMGTAMAYGDRVHYFPAAAVALACALLIQIIANFVNDYADFKKGTDDHTRIGPLRVTQAGLVTPREMKIAIFLAIFITLLLGLYLVLRGGIPVVLMGVLSILSGIIYTAGPFPLGYIGLADIFVLIFFGPVAAAGTYYVQALSIHPWVIAAGFAPGLFSVAILTVNNLRDLENDKNHNKKTLAVRFGKNFAMYEYAFSFFLACLIPIAIYFISGKYKWASISTLTLFLSPIVLKPVFSETNGLILNKTLANTGKLLIIYGVLYSIGWILSSRF